jgi:MarR family transcriptional regulator, organic hydroperoxide resistance regulator
MIAVESIDRHFDLKQYPSHGATMTTGSMDAPLPQVLDFMQLLWALVHGLERTSKGMASALGVTGPQRLVVRVVGLFPGVSAGDLATILHVHPSTLTGVLQRLVAQRLLLRVSSPGDRRRAVLRLAPKGARLNTKRRGTVESAVAAVLIEVPPADRLAARRVLQRLARQLGANAAALTARARTRRAARGPGKSAPRS